MSLPAWLDPLPNAASGEARCFRGLLDGLAGRVAPARQDLEAGIEHVTMRRTLP